MLDNGWYSWFASLVAFGEFMIGVALILGAFVGIAAFFGALLNWNFIMARAASTNPVLLKRGLDKGAEAIVAELKSLAKPVRDRADIAHVAAEIGDLIAEVGDSWGCAAQSGSPSQLCVSGGHEIPRRRLATPERRP